MSDEAVSTTPAYPTGWIRLWHPRGVQVTLPVTADPLPYDRLLANVSAMLEAGWLPQAPGLEAGEEVVEVGYVVRREKENDDKSVTPVIDLYPADDSKKFAILTLYLNNEDQENAFSQAVGVTLSHLQVYPGSNKVERGDKAATDRFVHKLPRSVRAVYGANPKWNQADAEAAAKAGKMYPVAKRKFLRWADAPAKPAPQQPGEEPADVKAWRDFLATDPPLANFNREWPKLSRVTDKEAKKILWQMTCDHARQAGFVWDGDKKVFEQTEQPISY